MLWEGVPGSRPRSILCEGAARESSSTGTGACLVGQRVAGSLLAGLGITHGPESVLGQRDSGQQTAFCLFSMLLGPVIGCLVPA